MDLMPTSFFKGEVVVGSKRHLIFMTDEQLALLKTAVRWYADGTFKTINFPFTQLFSLHGFLKKNGQLKQVPLCFVFMSGRTQRDYRKVFEKILELLGGECAVKEFVTDFERAIWRGVKETLPEVNIIGCGFHWCQAVFRNLKKIGLVGLYRSNANVHKYLERFLSLHLIPMEKIPRMFEYLERKIISLWETDEELKKKKTQLALVKKFVSYMRANWIVSKVWPPAKWCVFNQPIRTNNDAEGWNNRINCHNKDKMNFYLLVPILYQESKLIPLYKKLLCGNKLIKRTLKLTDSVNKKLFELWNSYPEQINGKKLLKAVSEVYAESNVLNEAMCLDDEKDDVSE
jgi:hypothetical protein